MLFNAKEIGKKLSYRFLQTPHLFYLGINEPLHYAEDIAILGVKV
ncbi:hypothetical protein FACS189485_18330 [Spirochaetia bacterium]|nr:hypothetical protein FACS189485_18330 [Spirochaetia bacterium]